MSISYAALRHLRQCVRAAALDRHTFMTTGARADSLFARSSTRKSIHSASYTVRRIATFPSSSRRSTACAQSEVSAEFSSHRAFSASAVQRHGHLDAPKPGEELHVSIIDQNGQKHDFEVSEGDNLLDIAQANDLEMEGACGGSCACSTCHVIVEDEAMFDRIPEAEDDENDMLDLAFGLTETSRLGCQVKMTKDLDGLVVRLPSATRNLQKSDFEKK